MQQPGPSSLFAESNQPVKNRELCVCVPWVTLLLTSVLQVYICIFLFLRRFRRIATMRKQAFNPSMQTTTARPGSSRLKGSGRMQCGIRLLHHDEAPFVGKDFITQKTTAVVNTTGCSIVYRKHAFWRVSSNLGVTSLPLDSMCGVTFGNGIQLS